MRARDSKKVFHRDDWHSGCLGMLLGCGLESAQVMKRVDFFTATSSRAYGTTVSQNKIL